MTVVLRRAVFPRAIEIETGETVVRDGFVFTDVLHSRRRERDAIRPATDHVGTQNQNGRVTAPVLMNCRDRAVHR